MRGQRTGVTGFQFGSATVGFCHCAASMGCAAAPASAAVANNAEAPPPSRSVDTARGAEATTAPLEDASKPAPAVAETTAAPAAAPQEAEQHTDASAASRTDSGVGEANSRRDTGGEGPPQQPTQPTRWRGPSRTRDEIERRCAEVSAGTATPDGESWSHVPRTEASPILVRVLGRRRGGRSRRLLRRRARWTRHTGPTRRRTAHRGWVEAPRCTSHA